jgi:hypothetical protein
MEIKGKTEVRRAQVHTRNRLSAGTAWVRKVLYLQSIGTGQNGMYSCHTKWVATEEKR